MKTNDLCKNCSHWKNKQAELEYSEHDGICTCFEWEFKIYDNPYISLLDRRNLSGKHMNVHRFESQKNIVPLGAVNQSQYCFVTSDIFGCINFKKV